MYHAKLSWTWEAKRQNRKAAEMFLSSNCRLTMAANAESVIKEVQEFQRVIQSQHQLEKGSLARFGQRHMQHESSWHRWQRFRK